MQTVLSVPHSKFKRHFPSESCKSGLSTETSLPVAQASASTVPFQEIVEKREELETQLASSEGL